MGTQHPLVAWMGLGWDCHCCPWLCPWLCPGPAWLCHVGARRRRNCPSWVGGRGITHEEERFLQSGEDTLGTWQSRFPSAVGTALHQLAVKLGTCRTVPGDMWDRVPGSALGAWGPVEPLGRQTLALEKGRERPGWPVCPTQGPYLQRPRAASPCCHATAEGGAWLWCP